MATKNNATPEQDPFADALPKGKQGRHYDEGFHAGMLAAVASLTNGSAYPGKSTLPDESTKREVKSVNSKGVETTREQTTHTATEGRCVRWLAKYAPTLKVAEFRYTASGNAAVHLTTK